MTSEAGVTEGHDARRAGRVAQVRARRAAVATGGTAAAPPIPRVRTRGVSDPLMPVDAGMSGRASLVSPPRTSARLARNAAPSTVPTRSDHVQRQRGEGSWREGAFLPSRP